MIVFVAGAVTCMFTFISWRYIDCIILNGVRLYIVWHQFSCESNNALPFKLTEPFPLFSSESQIHEIYLQHMNVYGEKGNNNLINSTEKRRKHFKANRSTLALLLFICRIHLSRVLFRRNGNSIRFPCFNENFTKIMFFYCYPFKKIWNITAITKTATDSLAYIACSYASNVDFWSLYCRRKLVEFSYCNSNISQLHFVCFFFGFFARMSLSLNIKIDTEHV